ncbi:MAG: hypothetical protein WA426_22210, partial [Silvibacterium sp.]
QQALSFVRAEDGLVIVPSSFMEQIESSQYPAGYLLNIVLDHRRSTDDLDVDRHAPAVTCGGRPGGEMSG